MTFDREGNCYKAPTGDEWTRKRTCINNFINRKVRDKDYIIPLGDYNGVDGEEYYDPRDFIHLNSEGLFKVFDKIEVAVNRVFEEIAEVVRKREEDQGEERDSGNRGLKRLREEEDEDQDSRKNKVN